MRLLLLFLYSIPCELAVSLAPHEPAVLYAAAFHAPLAVAAAAAAGTLVAELLNYELLRRTPARYAERLPAVRAPFAALCAAGLVPVIPFSPLRLLVLARGYPRGRYLAAAVGSRALRFYLVAALGRAVRLPAWGAAALLVALALAVTLPGVRRSLSQRGPWFASSRSFRRAWGRAASPASHSRRSSGAR